MNSDESIKALVSKLQEGDPEAAQQLWDHFFGQLIVLTRARLQSSARGMADEEDIALSALKSFCFAVREGRFEELTCRDSLWRLLLTITYRKISDKQNYDRRSKRDTSRLVSLTMAEGAWDQELTSLVSREPDPKLAALCSEEVHRLLESLEHPDLKRLAILKMEGYTNVEISQRMECSLTSVERKLRTIRSIWSQSE